ncbi:uncharacterized protein LOC128192229 [Crassostrea angulata]|uniref:uncharacterized protein LOC128192229 n=1 Tax=Magallana angulata TaxID=2784310 RepID=UPI0022B19B2E|nr:uncharacterized protein LOC128192229 [Crassostrea angulata]
MQGDLKQNKYIMNLPNSYVPSLLCIVLVCHGYTLVCGYEIVKPAYMGRLRQNVYIVHSEERTWLDAQNICSSSGLTLQFNSWDAVNWYIKVKAERKGWRSSDDVWIGMIKHANSNFWYPTMHGICKEENKTLPGQLFHERQCAVLNMSGNSYSGNFNIMYAAACEEKFLGFVCLANHGLVPSDVEFHILSEVVEKGTNQKSWQNVTITECAEKSFYIFVCYAATYFPETRICIAECTDMDNVPEIVTLVNSTINSTVLLRTYNKVFLNKTVSDFPTITDPEQFPCKPNARTTQGSTYVSTIVYETEEVSSKCSCICSTKTNISIDELQEKLNEIKEDLAVTKTSLSSSQRKKICAQDERTSSTRIGILGLCVIIGILLVLVVSDIFNGVLHISKIQGKKKNRNI